MAPPATSSGASGFFPTPDGKTIEIVPEAPIPPDRTIGVVFRVANPSNGGMYQFNALAQAPGKVDIAGYLGSWVIEIQPGGAR